MAPIKGAYPITNVELNNLKNISNRIVILVYKSSTCISFRYIFQRLSVKITVLKYDLGP